MGVSPAFILFFASPYCTNQASESSVSKLGSTKTESARLVTGLKPLTVGGGIFFGNSSVNNVNWLVSLLISFLSKRFLYFVSWYVQQCFLIRCLYLYIHSSQYFVLNMMQLELVQANYKFPELWIHEYFSYLQVPQFILDDMIDSELGGYCNIICTQPRRIAVRSRCRSLSFLRG